MSGKTGTDTFRALLMAALAMVFLGGCVSQAPLLVGEPTPAPTPPPPLPTIVQAIEFQQAESDALGVTVYDSDTHYERYVTFEELRVYDYGANTFLDGYCVNTYPEALYGAYRLEYRDEGGTVIAEGTLLFDEEAHEIPPGRTRVYGMIDTDMRVDTLPLHLLQTEPVRPYQGEEGIEGEAE